MMNQEIISNIKIFLDLVWSFGISVFAIALALAMVYIMLIIRRANRATRTVERFVDAVNYAFAEPLDVITILLEKARPFFEIITGKKTKKDK